MKVILGGHSSKEGISVTDYGIIIIDTDGAIARMIRLRAPIMAQTGSNITGIFNSLDNLVELLQSPDFRNITIYKTYGNKMSEMLGLDVCGGGRQYTDGTTAMALTILQSTAQINCISLETYVKN